MTVFQSKQPSSFEGTVQTITIGAASAQVANPFGSETTQIRLCANTAVNYVVGNGALTATTAGSFLPANTDRMVTVRPGESIAAIEAATNGLVTATTGTLWITEQS
jgi:hypothetical protein